MKKGECRFCGQIMMLEPQREDEDLDELATRQCKCKEAEKYRNGINRIEKTQDNIDLALADNHPKAADFLKSAVPMIMCGCMEKVSIDIGDGTKCVLKSNAKGNMKVEVSKTKKAAYDE